MINLGMKATIIGIILLASNAFGATYYWNEIPSGRWSSGVGSDLTLQSGDVVYYADRTGTSPSYSYSDPNATVQSFTIPAGAEFYCNDPNRYSQTGDTRTLQVDDITVTGANAKFECGNSTTEFDGAFTVNFNESAYCKLGYALFRTTTDQTFPIDFSASSASFDINLAYSATASNNGTASISLTTNITSLANLASTINTQINGQIGVTAYATSGRLEFQAAATLSDPSEITLDNFSGQASTGSPLYLEHDGSDSDIGTLTSKDAVCQGFRAMSGADISMYGDHGHNTWTQMDATASSGSGTIQVVSTSGWSVGDEITIAAGDILDSPFATSAVQNRSIKQLSSNVITLGESGNSSTAEVLSKRVIGDGPYEYTTNNSLTYDYGNPATAGTLAYRYTQELGSTQDQDGNDLIDRILDKQTTPDPIKSLDERTEVVNKTRNIRFVGDSTMVNSELGVHLMFMSGVNSVEIDGIEVKNGGRVGQLARYPLHFHHAGDRSSTDFIRNSSVHDSFNRCITVHQTQNLIIEKNTCVNTIGHAYFLEDGNETGIYLIDNIAILAVPPDEDMDLLESDQYDYVGTGQVTGPAGFWIANPDNVLIGNSASSTGSGYWTSFKTDGYQLSGTSAPFETSPAVISGNRVHTTVDGFVLDGHPVGPCRDNPRNPCRGATADAQNRSGDHVLYGPLYTGGDENAEKVIYLDDLTSYKNERFAIWMGGEKELTTTHMVLADSVVDVGYVFNQNITNSLIVGASQGLSQAEHDFLTGGTGKLNGILLYDGPGLYEDLHFARFNISGMDALPYGLFGNAADRPQHFTNSVTFDAPTTTNLIDFNHGSVLDNWATGLYVTDGSFGTYSGFPTGYSVRPDKTATTDDDISAFFSAEASPSPMDCKTPSEWSTGTSGYQITDASMCPGHFVQMWHENAINGQIKSINRVSNNTDYPDVEWKVRDGVGGRVRHFAYPDSLVQANHGGSASNTSDLTYEVAYKDEEFEQDATLRLFQANAYQDEWTPWFILKAPDYKTCVLLGDNIIDVDTGNDEFEITGDHTSRASVNDTFTVEHSTGNNGSWTISAITYSSGTERTTIAVTGDITNGTIDGRIIFSDSNLLSDVITEGNSHHLRIRSKAAFQTPFIYNNADERDYYTYLNGVTSGAENRLQYRCGLDTDRDGVLNSDEKGNDVDGDGIADSADTDNDSYDSNVDGDCDDVGEFGDCVPDVRSITDVTASAGQIKISGDLTGRYYVGGLITVTGSTANDGDYDAVAVSYDGGSNKTTITLGKNIVGVDITGETFQISGDHTSRFSVNDTVTVTGSTGNDGSWTVSAITYNSGSGITTITVTGNITDETVDGRITLPINSTVDGSVIDDISPYNPLVTGQDTDQDGLVDYYDDDDDDDNLFDVHETDTGTYVSNLDTGSDPLDTNSDNDYGFGDFDVNCAGGLGAGTYGESEVEDNMEVNYTYLTDLANPVRDDADADGVLDYEEGREVVAYFGSYPIYICGSGTDHESKNELLQGGDPDCKDVKVTQGTGTDFRTANSNALFDGGDTTACGSNAYWQSTSSLSSGGNVTLHFDLDNLRKKNQKLAAIRFQSANVAANYNFPKTVNLKVSTSGQFAGEESNLGSVTFLPPNEEGMWGNWVPVPDYSTTSRFVQVEITAQYDLGGTSTDPVRIAEVELLVEEDNDEDGYSDAVEVAQSTDPDDGGDTPTDTDGDYQPDATDVDDDNDGLVDAEDSNTTNMLSPGYTAYWTNTSTTDYDAYGYSVSDLGDINGDGYDDVLVGSPQGDSAYTNSGNVYVVSGASGSVLHTISGSAANTYLGYAVNGAGDVNNDGYNDILAGNWGGSGTPGLAKVFSGADGSTVLMNLTGASNGDYFGFSVSNAGDVNNDGYDDVIIGAQGVSSSTGQAKVYSGSDSSVLHTFNGGATGELFGHSVSTAGDVNNDGYSDLIVGAYRATVGSDGDAGYAKVYSGNGGSVLYTFNGEQADDFMGEQVATAGDVNGDGYDDVIVSAAGDDSNGTPLSTDHPGYVRVYSGKDGATLHTIETDDGDNENGRSVGYLGDINQDGYDDILVGDYGLETSVGTGSGITRVYSGLNGNLLYTLALSDAPEGWFGYSVSGAGDVDNDGYVDIIVGAPWDTGTGNPWTTDPDRGSAHIYSGATNYDIWDNDLDGVLNEDDAFVNDSNEWLDTDGDGTGNNADTDDDNDGLSDSDETTLGIDPLNKFDPPRANLSRQYLITSDDVDYANTTYGRYVIWNGDEIHDYNYLAKDIDFFFVPGYTYGCALYDDGDVDCGNGTLANVVKAQSAGDHSCALMTDDSIECWFGSSVGSTSNPTTTGLSSTLVDFALHDGTSDGIGCAVDGSGSYACWDNDGTYGATSTSFTNPNSPTLTALSVVAVGANHICFIESGKVHCRTSDSNASNQLGPDTNTDGYVDGITTARKIVAGDDFTCALIGDYEIGNGEVQCWGSATFISGQPTTLSLTDPVSITALTGRACAVDVGVTDESNLFNSVKCFPDLDTDGDSTVDGSDTDDDDDGISDATEATNGTERALADTDYDGYCDGAGTGCTGLTGNNDAYPLDPNQH